MKTRTAVMSILAASALLAGCGLRGDLERPAPLWGDPRTDSASPASEAPPDPNAPVPVDNPDR